MEEITIFCENCVVSYQDEEFPSKTEKRFSAAYFSNNAEGFNLLPAIYQVDELFKGLMVYSFHFSALRELLSKFGCFVKYRVSSLD